MLFHLYTQNVKDNVGTPGLGYPHLLCLGKGLVVIFNYIQAAGPLWSEALFSQQRSGPVPRPGKVRGRHVSQERQALRHKQPGLRTSRRARTLIGSRTPRIATGPLSKGRFRRPASEWSGGDTCMRPLVSILRSTYLRIHCGRWTSALI